MKHILLGLIALAVGLALFVAPLQQFAVKGKGTLAPWDPPKHLVVEGPPRGQERLGEDLPTEHPAVRVRQAGTDEGVRRAGSRDVERAQHRAESSGARLLAGLRLSGAQLGGARRVRHRASSNVLSREWAARSR